jgi:mRNA-degrading endonuclease YafQ of YafQ-DinJ toxin-antitoxin module
MGGSREEDQAFAEHTVSSGGNRQAPEQTLGYGLHSSILDVYKHISPTEAVYSIKEVDALKQENKALKLVVGTYELMRQEFVAILETLAQKNSRAIENLDPRQIQKVVLEENFIEKQLNEIGFDLNSLIASQDLEAQLKSHQCTALLTQSILNSIRTDCQIRSRSSQPRQNPEREQRSHADRRSMRKAS